MPAATSKEELIAVTRKAYQTLDTLLDGVPRHARLIKDDGGVSIRDIVVHRRYWIDLFLGWSADARSGRPVHMPAEGYGWGTLKDLNARIRDENQTVDWDEACTLLANAHARLVQHLETADDTRLYGAAMPGGNGTWTEGRYAESAGPSHYRSAAKYIRARLREMS